MEEQDVKHCYQDAQSWLDPLLRQGQAFIVLVSPCKAKAVSSAHQGFGADTEALASARGLQGLLGPASGSKSAKPGAKSGLPFLPSSLFLPRPSLSA